ncbi:hypothetical protein GQX74_001771 [Glossina fuscipes]|nr:hypothetical protein GQX74_001771 [Glossina fuscipes]
MAFESVWMAGWLAGWLWYMSRQMPYFCLITVSIDLMFIVFSLPSAKGNKRTAKERKTPPCTIKLMGYYCVIFNHITKRTHTRTLISLNGKRKVIVTLQSVCLRISVNVYKVLPTQSSKTCFDG